MTRPVRIAGSRSTGRCFVSSLGSAQVLVIVSGAAPFGAVTAGRGLGAAGFARLRGLASRRLDSGKLGCAPGQDGGTLGHRVPGIRSAHHTGQVAVEIVTGRAFDAGFHVREAPGVEPQHHIALAALQRRTAHRNVVVNADLQRLVRADAART